MIDIIIPHSNTHKTREQNLKYILRYYKKNLKGANIVVVELNSKTNLSQFSYVTHLVYEMKGFVKSFCFNEGVKNTEHDLLLLVDNDILIDKEVLHNIHKIIKEVDMVLPYMPNKWIDYTKEETDVVFKEDILTGRSMRITSEAFDGKPYVRIGGACIIKRKAYEKIGGFDPYFVGWGCEDDAFYSKAKKLITVKRTNTYLHHLYHDRSNSNPYSNPHYLKNKRLYLFIDSLDKEQLIKYIKTLGTAHFKNNI